MVFAGIGINSSYYVKLFVSTKLTGHSILLPHQVSEEGRGIASISHMLTITRIHNSIAAVGGMRR